MHSLKVCVCVCLVNSALNTFVIIVITALDNEREIA